MVDKPVRDEASLTSLVLADKCQLLAVRGLCGSPEEVLSQAVLHVERRLK